MQLPLVYDFFNYSSKPWKPVVTAAYGEWSPPGLCYNSCILHLLNNKRTNSVSLPAELKLHSCQSVSGGSMDIIFYAGNADLPWGGYPWKDGNILILAQLHVENTNGSVVSRRCSAPIEKLRELVNMASISDELRLGVACKSVDGGQMLWHSAQMMASYN